MASDIRKNFGNMCEGDKFATKLCMNIFHRKVSAVSLYAKNYFFSYSFKPLGWLCSVAAETLWKMEILVPASDKPL